MKQKTCLYVVLYFVIYEIKLLNSNSSGFIELYAQNFRKIRQAVIWPKSSCLAHPCKNCSNQLPHAYLRKIINFHKPIYFRAEKDFIQSYEKPGKYFFTKEDRCTSANGTLFFSNCANVFHAVALSITFLFVVLT